jgi:hypothetical protein
VHCANEHDRHDGRGMMLRVIIATLFLVACGDSLPCGGIHSEDQGLHYTVNPTLVSPEGIHIDAPAGFNIASIDRAVDEVDACLAARPPMTEAERGLAWCPVTPQVVPIPRGCLTVKVAPWIPSCDGTMQLLDEPAPVEACVGKVFPPQCVLRTCHYRAGLQGEVVITTPNLALIKDPLVRLATGCYFPWNSATLGHCMQRSEGSSGTNVGIP